MDKKKELKQKYKEIKTEAGVFQVRNTQNQKILVDSTRNLKTLNGKLFQLNTGVYPTNQRLTEELQQYGPNAFVIEVLEVLEKPEDPFFDEKDALKKMQAQWMEKLQPFGDRGYNEAKRCPPLP
ncbi:MAG: GIY-YIG nuclease family protein [Syntrophomonas sp.]